jgi:LysR family transcriptional activator of nhaA
MGTLRGRASAHRQSLRIGALTTLSRNFQLEFLKPLVPRSDVELVVRSGALTDLVAQLETHEIDIVLANSPAPREGRSAIRNHLIAEQPVSLVSRSRTGRGRFRFPMDLNGEPLLLPSVRSGIRIAFDRVLEEAGVEPIVHAEVDDMAMLRLLARERDGIALVPPIVVREELDSGILVELCKVEAVAERFFAIVQQRQFPNPLINELLGIEMGLDEKASIPMA